MHETAFGVDYLALAGGINSDNSNPGRVFFVTGEGNRRNVDLTEVVQPGQSILVDRDAWAKFVKFTSDFGIVTGFVGGALLFFAVNDGTVPWPW